ncbi:MAG TPA: hypothetical protein VM386_05115 [Acidimicrobiales bacterium]|nr:hypothetical protein [Acidimicrobiales bacterium]
MVSLSGWYVGYVIALVVLVVVVVLVGMILGLARRIGVQALTATQALDEGRINTLALWDVDKINGGIRSIISSAEEARMALEGER